jgi:hypothetical protein
MKILRTAIDWLTLGFSIPLEVVRGGDGTDKPLERILSLLRFPDDRYIFRGFQLTIISDDKQGIRIERKPYGIFVQFKGRYWIKRKALKRVRALVESVATEFQTEFYITRIDIAVDFVGTPDILPKADGKTRRWTGMSKSVQYLPERYFGKNLELREQTLSNSRWRLNLYRKDIELRENGSKEKIHYYRQFFDIFGGNTQITRMELQHNYRRTCERWRAMIINNTTEEIAFSILDYWAKGHRLEDYKPRKRAWVINASFKKLFSTQPSTEHRKNKE